MFENTFDFWLPLKMWKEKYSSSHKNKRSLTVCKITSSAEFIRKLGL
jgi:hypothetical protein